MALDTPHRAGVPNWADCATTDLSAAEAFYAHVFGWTSERVADSTGAIYSMQYLDGRRVAGLYGLTDQMKDLGVPPHWSTYFEVADLDASLEVLKNEGGTLLDGPMEEDGVGKIAVVQDPVGAYLRLWTPAENQGGQVFNTHGAMLWNELCTEETEKADAFYKALLNLDPDVIDAGGRPYTLLKLGGDPVAGILPKRPEMEFEGSFWDVYFAANDVDAVVARVREAGGSVLSEPFDLPVGERMAVVRDPAGATFEIMSMNTMGQG